MQILPKGTFCQHQWVWFLTPEGSLLWDTRNKPVCSETGPEPILYLLQSHISVGLTLTGTSTTQQAFEWYNVCQKNQQTEECIKINQNDLFFCSVINVLEKRHTVVTYCYTLKNTELASRHQAAFGAFPGLFCAACIKDNLKHLPRISNVRPLNKAPT